MEQGINKNGLIDTYRVSLSDLYDTSGLPAFRDRFANFIASDPHASAIAMLEGNELVYSSESYIPGSIDPRKRSLVMVLGNPAPESVAIEAMFAYENRGTRYHRFWRVLDSTGVLCFGKNPDSLTPHDKMQRLFSGNYSSPFNLFIVPFYSFPTPPGGEWNGVAGMRRLFGRAFPAIEEQDRLRIKSLFDAYLREGDAVTVFQKDAYLALSIFQEKPVAYDYRGLLQQPQVSSLPTKAGSADLVCMLPTRLLHSGQTKDVLSRLALGQELT